MKTELTCDENGFKNIDHSDKAVPVNLGDWAYLIGSAYSGSGVPVGVLQKNNKLKIVVTNTPADWYSHRLL